MKDLTLGWHCFKVIGVNGIKKSPASEIECVELVEIPEEPEIPEDGIEEISSSLLLYPNPVNDKLNIVTEIKVEDVSIFDIYGRIQSLSILASQHLSISVDVSGLNEGVYFVMIKTNDGVVMKRFVKE